MCVCLNEFIYATFIQEPKEARSRGSDLLELWAVLSCHMPDVLSHLSTLGAGFLIDCLIERV